MQPEYTNQLIDQTSPYLLQHAHNPVNWYPWNEQSLAKARQENKLILLSIGYSACHWCHVMAHESFENPDIAALMNKLFINIKVDREERPDLDKIYQSAHQHLNQRGGGWPLTVILSPEEQIPFFAGTYFPDKPKHGMPSIKEILQGVYDFYFENTQQIQQQNSSLLQAMARLTTSTNSHRSAISANTLDQARKQLASNFDPRYAGFGKAPKFPHPTNLERLLRHWSATKNHREDLDAKKMLYLTLHAMASGGLYDQLGGGFFRYSVDDKWMIPHFEKMLYDNGPLLSLYAQASVLLHDKTFQRIAQDTARWIIREMQSEQGGYYSTLDADSEGEEGKFYRWDKQQLQQLLSEDYPLFEAFYGIDKAANFEQYWHLYVAADANTIAQQHAISLDEFHQKMSSTTKLLFEQRERRIRPARDEKILSSWNGLMAKGMAISGRLLHSEDFIRSAQKSIDFIQQNLFKQNRLLASSKDGKAHLMAYLDDYAFLLDALLECLQSQWRSSDLNFAIQLADTMLEFFEDKQQGGFFFTAHDHEQLIQRPKEYMDDAIPSGNGIAAFALARLGHLLGESRYLDATERTIQNAWQQINTYPAGFGAMLSAVEEYLYPPQIILLRGEGEELKKMQTLCHAAYNPRRLCFTIPQSETLPGKLTLQNTSTKATAFICEATQCLPAIHTIDELQTHLNKTK